MRYKNIIQKANKDNRVMITDKEKYFKDDKVPSQVPVNLSN